MLSRFYSVHACDGRTDRRSDTWIFYMPSGVSVGYKSTSKFLDLCPTLARGFSAVAELLVSLLKSSIILGTVYKSRCIRFS